MDEIIYERFFLSFLPFVGPNFFVFGHDSIRMKSDEIALPWVISSFSSAFHRRPFPMKLGRDQPFRWAARRA
jgi:hypothetical protein